MKKGSMIPRKARTPSLPSKEGNAADNTRKKPVKSTFVPKRRSLTPTNIKQIPSQTDDASRAVKLCTDFVETIKKNNSLKRTQVLVIDRYSKDFYLLARRAVRMGGFENQRKSDAPKNFWECWNNIIQTHAKQLKGIESSLIDKIKDSYKNTSKIAAEINENSDSISDDLKNQMNTLNRVLDLVQYFINGDKSSDLQVSIKLLTDVHRNAAHYQQLRKANEPIKKLQQSLIDYNKFFTNQNTFLKQHDLTLTELQKMIYKPEIIAIKQAAPIKSSVNSTPRASDAFDHDHEEEYQKQSTNSLDQDKYEENTDEDYPKLKKENERKKADLRRIQEEKRALQRELIIAKDANAKSALPHNSTVRAMKTQKAKVEKAKDGIDALRQEVNQLQKRRDALKASVDKLVEQSSSINVQDDDNIQDENRRLTEQLTKARAEKSALEEEWLRLKAINTVLRQNLSPQQAKPYAENEPLRDEFIKLSREHLVLVEQSLRQNYSNERARSLGEMETDKGQRITYGEALEANKELYDEIRKLKETRDDMHDELEKAILKRYIMQAEQVHKTKQKTAATSSEEKKLLAQLKKVKEDFARQKSLYLKDIQKKQLATIANKYAQTTNEIAELRTDAFQIITDKRAKLKSLRDMYDKLQPLYEEARLGDEDELEFDGETMTLDEAKDRMDKIIEEYKNGMIEAQKIATKEASDELRVISQAANEFDENAKNMAAWTDEVYATLLQTQARMQVLNIQSDILQKKLNDSNVDVDKALNMELNKTLENSKKTSDVLERVKDAMRGLLSDLGIQYDKDMTPEKMMEAADSVLANESR